VFVYAAGQLIAEYSTAISQTPSVSYTTADHLGSPRVITNELGQVSSRRDFMPFGEELYAGVGGRTGDTGLKYSSNQDDIRQKFTGYQKDKETGLDFAEARMYENRFGRFTALDPLLASGKSSNPQTFNRFIYVGNNPVMITDPSGLDWYRQPIKDSVRFTYQWFDKDPGGNWRAVNFGDNVFLPINEWVTGDGQALGTVYLDRYRDSVLTQEQFSTMAASAIPGGACFANPQCAGLRNPLRDNQSVFEAQRFSTGVPIGVRNQAKSWVDVPNGNFAPPVVNWFVTDSLNTRFGVQPFFNYETPRPGSESIGAFVGARSVDFGIFAATGKLATSVGARFSPQTSSLPEIVYRGGTPSPGNLTPRPSDAGRLSFRESLSNPFPLLPGQRPVFEVGKPYFGVRTSDLPSGSVILDNTPPGHVSVWNVSPSQLKSSVCVRGKCN